MSSSQLAGILLKNSTNQFYIEYRGYLFNHISHGIVALARMGANAERIERFIDWYKPRLEEADRFKDGEKTVDSAGLMGARKAYYALLDDYSEQLYGKFGGSMESLIAYQFPKLFPGLVGSALHGIIHLGYGYAAKNSRVVCEGLAYMHYSYIPLRLSSVPLSVEDIGKGPCDITEVIKSISEDTELMDFTRTKFKSEEYASLHVGDFSRRVKSLFDYRGDDLIRYAYRVQIPGIQQMEKLDIEKQCNILLRWLLDSAITVYAVADKHDFFLLHGVTAAWGLLQVSPVAIGKSRQLTLEAVTTYICALLAVYISRGAPKLCPELLSDDAHKVSPTWMSLLDITLAEDRDEHVFKLVQVCHELSQETENQHLQNLYLKAALRAINEPFKF